MKRPFLIISAMAALTCASWLATGPSARALGRRQETAAPAPSGSPSAASEAEAPTGAAAETAATAAAATAREQAEVQGWCADAKSAIAQLRWKLDPCPEGVSWKVGGHSIQGRPLVYAEFGSHDSRNATLILAMVHGDEITPFYVALKLAGWIQEHRSELDNKARIVVAPLANPDGFYRKPRWRMNANGVDVNRNFATHDWETRALKAWKVRFRSDPRRNPGARPASEPETAFQVELIHRVHPQKILSVHSPLNFMDYDGPTQLSLDQFPRDYVRECLKLRARLKAISGGFYPGSLGNYAGRELGIPTLTLELPTSNPSQAEAYWQKFSSGIRTMIMFEVPAFTSNLPPTSHGA